MQPGSPSEVIGRRIVAALVDIVVAIAIRVVSRRGGKPAPTAIAARTLLRAVDFLPILYLVGLVGDLVARTTVVEARAGTVDT